MLTPSAPCKADVCLCKSHIALTSMPLFVHVFVIIFIEEFQCWIRHP